MTTNEIIDKAVELLNTVGWCQGSYEANGGYCAAGAVDAARAIWGHGGDDAGVRELFMKRWGMHLITFNDMEGRTKEQVISALEACRV